MKLYWRYKKDGKWTWKPALVGYNEQLKAYVVEEEEESAIITARPVIRRCKCGTYLTTEGVARNNLTCARCARLRRERKGILTPGRK